MKSLRLSITTLFLATAVMTIILVSGCATSTDVGYMRSDCSSGFLSPSICLVTAKKGVVGSTGAQEITFQQVVGGKQLADVTGSVAATIGGAALVGPLGLAKSGTRVSQQGGGASQSQLQGQAQGQLQGNWNSNSSGHHGHED